MDIDLVSGTFDTIPLKFTLFEGPTIIFHFSDINCSSCLADQLSLLKNLSPIIDEKSIIIIGTMKSMKKMKQIYRKYNLHYSFYQNPQYTSILQDRDFIKDPYYMLVGNDGEITSFFLPPIRDSVTTELFLNQCSRFILDF
jgi:hypothetical protein